MYLKPHRIHLHFGLEKPVKILQLSDVHFSLADETDGEDLIKHAAARRNTFFCEAGYPERDPVGFLEDAMEYAKDFDCTVITGDILDFMSHANYVEAHRVLAGKDYMFCAGNHEFCPKVGVPDSFDRKAEKWGEVQSYFRGDMGFESRIVGGVNIIAADNGYYTWTEEQYEQLQKEVAKGYPIVIFCHVPLNCNLLDHNPHHKDLWAPDEVVATTRKVTKYITDEPAFKGIFAGHWHGNGDYELSSGKICHVIGGLFKGIVGEIYID